MKTIAVIGAGISGLTAAYYLLQRGERVEVFEASSRAGGVIRSERVDGYLVEHGPNTLQPGTPTLHALQDSLPLSSPRLDAAPEARQRYVVRGGRLLPLPTSPPAVLTSSLLSVGAKLGVLLEPLRGRRVNERADESIADFVRRRLGSEVLDYVVTPFIGGIFAGDPERLSLRHAFPRLHELEINHRSLILGHLRERRKQTGGQPPPEASRPYAFVDGLETLPQALADALGDALHLDSPVLSLRPTAAGCFVTCRQSGRTETRNFDGVICTVPLHRLSNLNIDSDIDLRPLVKVHYPPVAVVATGFRREAIGHPLDGFGFLVPAREAEYRILGTLFSSTLFPSRAPEGHALLTTFVGGSRYPDLARAGNERLLARVQKDLSSLLSIQDPPDFTQVTRWPQAIPQYEMGYGDVQRLLDRVERRHPNLGFAGNYRDGISVNDAAASGEAMASHLLDRL